MAPGDWSKYIPVERQEKFQNKGGKSMKKVGTSLYVHVSNIGELGEKIEKIVEERKKMIDDFKYHVIKFDTDTENVTFIECEEFDKKHEPMVGRQYLTKKNGEKKIMPSKGQVYHKKYAFVNENYTGFDIEAEKKRAELYDELMKKHEDKRIKSKIGYKKKWLEVLEWMNMEE